MQQRMPVGIEDFKEIRSGYYYVDKTPLIKELLDHHTKAVLITRPRRFGKTLAMSMLSNFFSIEEKASASLFDGLFISKPGNEKYMEEQGKHPVIFLTMKSAQNNRWEMLLISFKRLIAREYDKHSYLLKADTLTDTEKKYYQKILDMTASVEDYQISISYLTWFLYKYYNKKPIVLIDEYDAPLQCAYDYGFYDEAISYFKVFYNETLKTNLYLDFAILTGVLRIAKESIFSGLNNLEVDSVISGRYMDAFGFTLDEVNSICKAFHCESNLEQLKFWYDGYHFGSKEIYNPWSVTNFINNDSSAKPYWVNTSGNSILKFLLSNVDTEKIKTLQRLLNGETVGVTVNESVIYDDIQKDKSALFTMLLTTGYLTIDSSVPNTYNRFNLRIPNQEIRELFKTEILNHLLIGTKQNDFDDMFSALFSGDAEFFNTSLENIIQKSASTFDTANKECFYHGFMLGMSIPFQDRGYIVKSNREGGLGRFDLAIIPKDPTKTAVLMEFKYAESKDGLSVAAKHAIEQIHTMQYEKELESLGVSRILSYGVAFYGKHVCVVAK